MFIVFLGVDGSGKSSIVAKIRNKSLSVFHFCPTKRYNSSKVVSNPHDQNPYSTVKSILKLIFLFFQFWIGYIKQVRSKSFIIGDRYIYDIYIDPLRYRLNLNQKILKKLIFLFPTPDFVFYCYGNPLEIHNRKPEIGLYQIQQQQQKLFNLGKKNVNWIGLDTTSNSLEEVALSVLERIGI